MNSERQIQAFRNHAKNGESVTHASLAPRPRNTTAPGSVSIQDSKSPEIKKVFFPYEPNFPVPGKK
jgi:hypothetical protein